MRQGVLTSTGDENTQSVYTMYYNFREPIAKIQGHRVLAINRGEREDVLKVKIEGDFDAVISMINRKYVLGTNELSRLVSETCTDAFERLIFPSVEREIRNTLTENASRSEERRVGKEC